MNLKPMIVVVCSFVLIACSGSHNASQESFAWCKGYSFACSIANGSNNPAIYVESNSSALNESDVYQENRKFNYGHYITADYLYATLATLIIEKQLERQKQGFKRLQSAIIDNYRNNPDPADKDSALELFYYLSRGVLDPGHSQKISTEFNGIYQSKTEARSPILNQIVDYSIFQTATDLCALDANEKRIFRMIRYLTLLPELEMSHYIQTYPKMMQRFSYFIQPPVGFASCLQGQLGRLNLVQEFPELLKLAGKQLPRLETSIGRVKQLNEINSDIAKKGLVLLEDAKVYLEPSISNHSVIDFLLAYSSEKSSSDSIVEFKLIYLRIAELIEKQVASQAVTRNEKAWLAQLPFKIAGLTDSKPISIESIDISESSLNTNVPLRKLAFDLTPVFIVNEDIRYHGVSLCNARNDVDGCK